jgi:hypothetical protein
MSAAAMLRRGATRVAARTLRALPARAASTITKAGDVSKPAGNAAFGGLHLGGGQTSEGSFFYRHVVPLGLWTAVSLNVAAFFSAGDEGVQILLHLDDFTGPILAPETPSSRLTERLERVVCSAAGGSPSPCGSAQSTSHDGAHCSPTARV